MKDYLSFRLRNREDAEDAAQEVFMVVARKLHTFDATSLITTWLYGITLNVGVISGGQTVAITTSKSEARPVS